MKKIFCILALTVWFLPIQVMAMNIFVKTLDNKHLTFDFNGTEKVEDVKLVLQDELKVSVDDQILIYAGKELDNDKTLMSYSIQKDSTLHVVLKGQEIIPNTDAYIVGNNYVIDDNQKIILLSSDASVRLIGDAKDYRIMINENATNVKLVLDNYKAKTGGWKNTITLKDGSSVEIILIGENHLQAGSEASAIRVPQNTSLLITGDGSLSAKVDNYDGCPGCYASSAVIGGEYNYSFGNITIDSGKIYTSFSGSSGKSGIGSGILMLGTQNKDLTGSITLNGGEIHTEIIGSLSYDENSSGISFDGSGKAIVFADKMTVKTDDFNGIIFNEEGTYGIVKGNAVIDSDILIPNEGELVIEDSASLSIGSGVVLTNNGKIINNGQILNDGSILNNNTLENEGNIISITDIGNIKGNEIEVLLFDINVITNDGGTVEAPNNIKYEDIKNVIINPEKGYIIKSVKVNGIDRTNEVNNNILNLENIDSNLDIEVEFEKKVSDVIINPTTMDNVVSYVLLAIISIFSILLLIKYHKKYK